LVSALSTACVHRTRSQEVTIITNPRRSDLTIRPSPASATKRSASTVVQLEYIHRRPARLPLVVGGLASLAAGVTLGAMSLAACAGCGNAPRPEVLAGSIITGVLGFVALAAAASFGRTQPTNYVIRADARGYEPAELQVTVPRSETSWIRLDLEPTDSATTSTQVDDRPVSAMSKASSQSIRKPPFLREARFNATFQQPALGTPPDSGSLRAGNGP